MSLSRKSCARRVQRVGQHEDKLELKVLWSAAVTAVNSIRMSRSRESSAPTGSTGEEGPSKFIYRNSKYEYSIKKQQEKEHCSVFLL